MTNGVLGTAFNFGAVDRNVIYQIFICYSVLTKPVQERHRKNTFYEEKNLDKSLTHVIYCSSEFTTVINGHPLLDSILRYY